MPDKIEINIDLKIATINSFGKVSEKDISDSIHVISDLFKKGEITKVLVNTTKQTVVPNNMQLFNLSEQLPHGLKIAILSVHGQMTLNDLKFFELTSSNKGKLLRVFDSLKKANEWLSNK